MTTLGKILLKSFNVIFPARISELQTDISILLHIFNPLSVIDKTQKASMRVLLHILMCL